MKLFSKSVLFAAGCLLWCGTHAAEDEWCWWGSPQTLSCDVSWPLVSHHFPISTREANIPTLPTSSHCQMSNIKYTHHRFWHPVPKLANGILPSRLACSLFLPSSLPPSPSPLLSFPPSSSLPPSLCECLCGCTLWFRHTWRAQSTNFMYLFLLLSTLFYWGRVSSPT